MRQHAFTSQRAKPVASSDRPRRKASARTGGGQSLYVALFFISLLLFGFDQANLRLADGVRRLITDAALPVLQTMSRAISSVRSVVRATRDYSDLASRYERLRVENRELKSLRTQAYVVQARARAYEVLLDYVPENGTESIAARTIADVNSPFSRSVIVNAGAARGVTNGSAVIGEAGLVGRIISTGRKTSRVLLVTDINSRIPVFVGARRYRALLAGTNGVALSLMYLPASAILKPGDVVITSGEGRLLPEGLTIGGVRINTDGQPDVVVGRPPREADIVRILKYDTQIDVDQNKTPPLMALIQDPKPVAVQPGDGEADVVRTAVAVKAVAELPPARE